MNTKKEYLKIYDIRIGSANSDLLELYCKKTSIPTHQKAARHVVEKYILGHLIACKEDVETAIDYSKNMYYNSLSEAVEQAIRMTVTEDFNICKNCIYYTNGICKKNEIRTHSLHKGCINMDRKEVKRLEEVE